MATHIFDVASFRAQFPEFANSTTYPDITLDGYWTLATQYIVPDDSIVLSGSVLQIALNMMTAHLARSFSMLNTGQNSVVVSGASEGSVSVSLTPPPVKNMWQWWLATTPYGSQLNALLMVKSTSLPYIGGSLDRASFRKAGGMW